MAHKDQADQDALAAEWGLALDAEQASALAGEPEPGTDEPNEQVATQWAPTLDDSSKLMQSSKGGTERVLTQDEIDSLLGFSLSDVSLNDNSGIRAIIDSAMVSYERLPMLEI